MNKSLKHETKSDTVWLIRSYLNFFSLQRSVPDPPFWFYLKNRGSTSGSLLLIRSNRVAPSTPISDPSSFRLLSSLTDFFFSFFLTRPHPRCQVLGLDRPTDPTLPWVYPVVMPMDTPEPSKSSVLSGSIRRNVYVRLWRLYVSLSSTTISSKEPIKKRYTDGFRGPTKLEHRYGTSCVLKVPVTACPFLIIISLHNGWHHRWSVYTD